MAFAWSPMMPWPHSWRNRTSAESLILQAESHLVDGNDVAKRLGARRCSFSYA
jgi:hypothetical protein